MLYPWKFSGSDCAGVGATWCSGKCPCHGTGVEFYDLQAALQSKPLYDDNIQMFKGVHFIKNTFFFIQTAKSKNVCVIYILLGYMYSKRKDV